MTREDAIRWTAYVQQSEPWQDRVIEALDMAIEALEREPSDDLISRAEAIEAIENTDWYHQNQNKDMVSGANSDEHQAWYKADDVYKALEAVPSANRPKDGDLISRTEAIEALGEEPPVWCDEEYEIAERSQWRADVEAIESVPSADRPRGEQYKKGFEDAKRAFLVEYARESQNMRKRIAQLEVMLNAQKAISADRSRWTPCAERMPDDGKWAIWCSNEGAIGIARFKEDCYNHFYPNGTSFGLEDAVAWMPLPEPYKESDTE